MKKILILVTSFVLFVCNLYSQDTNYDTRVVGNTTHQYYIDPPKRTSISLGTMDSPINPISPNSHPLLDGSWSLVSNLSDEFNGSSLSSIWSKNIGWANTYPHHIAHNNQGTGNHILSNGKLIIDNKQQLFSQKMTGYLSDNEILTADGKSNLRQLDFTSGMIKTHAKLKYGYVEIRCKIPKSKYAMGNFWLWSEGGEHGNANNPYFYNEIDLFETKNATTMYTTTHFKDDNVDNDFHHHEKELVINDGTFFSDQMVTYGLRWEPNKLIFYINNKPFRVITEHIPSYQMHLILDQAFRVESNPMLPLDMSSDYEIDYIRVYQRNNYNISYPRFLINQEKGETVWSPVFVDEQQEIILDGSESYSVDNAYNIAVVEVNAQGQTVSPYYSQWFLNTNHDFIKNFDLRQFCSDKGLVLAPNKYYKVRLTGGGTWIEKSQYFKILPHQNQIDISINGSSSSIVNIPKPSSFIDFTPIIMDASKSVINNDDFIVYLEEVNSSGNTISPSVSKWYLDQPELLEEFDVRSFAEEFNFQLDYGKYYKLSVCTGGNWTCGAKVFYLEPCSNYIEFNINGNYSNVISIPYEYNEPELILSYFESNSCHENDYFIGVQKSNSSWGITGPEYSYWRMSTDDESADFSHFNLRYELEEEFGLELEPGNYYKVKVATANPWTEKTKLLYLQPCSSDPQLRINDQSSSFSNPIQFLCEEIDDIFISAWEGRTCDNHYYLGISECAGSNCLQVAGDWINADLARLMYTPTYENSSLAYLNLNDFLSNNDNANLNYNLQDGKTYQVGLCTGYDGWSCDYQYFSIQQCQKIVWNPFGKKSSGIQNDESFKVYPNPTKDWINIESLGSVIQDLKILDASGKTVIEEKVDRNFISISLNKIETGIYFLYITSSTGTKVEKLIKN